MSEQQRKAIDSPPMVAVKDEAYCRDCSWSAGYRWSSGKWRSKTLAEAKRHVRSTGHKVEVLQTRFALIQEMN